MSYKRLVILFIIISLLFLIQVSAQEVQTLGVFKVNTCVTLKQTCSNCTFINFSLSAPPDQSTILINQSMSRQSVNLWTFRFCNNSVNGEYIYDTYGDLNANTESGSVNYIINPIGKLLTTAQAGLYFMVFFISFILFLICFIFGVSAPGGNSKDEMTGYVIAVSNLKYLKYFLIGISYLLLMLMLYFGYVISYGYLDLDFLGNLFYLGFISTLVLILPLFILMVYLMISNKIRDEKIGEMLSRGLKVR